MSKKIIYLPILVVLLVLPLLILAQFDVSNTSQPQQNRQLNPADIINRIFNYFIWPLVVSIIIILFIIAGFAFITAQGEPGKLDKARQFLIWGIIGVILIIVAFSMIVTVRLVTGL